MSCQRFCKAQGGFSLIELMVIMLVIGVLVMIGLPMFLGARVRAEERVAQEGLHTAQVGGLVYWTAGGTFTGFDFACSAVPNSCDSAEAEESAVDWVGPDAPAERQVSIVIAAGNSLLIVTRATTGEFFCIAQSSGHSERGRAGAFESIDSMPECIGGWEGP